MPLIGSSDSFRYPRGKCLQYFLVQTKYATSSQKNIFTSTSRNWVSPQTPKYHNFVLSLCPCRIFQSPKIQNSSLQMHTAMIRKDQLGNRLREPLIHTQAQQLTHLDVDGALAVVVDDAPDAVLDVELGLVVE